MLYHTQSRSTIIITSIQPGIVCLQCRLYDILPGMELTPMNPLTLKPQHNKSPILVLSYDLFSLFTNELDSFLSHCISTSFALHVLSYLDTLNDKEIKIR